MLSDGVSDAHQIQRWRDLIDSGRWLEVERSDGTPHEAADPLWSELDRGGCEHRYVVAEGVLLVPGLAEVHGRLYCRVCGSPVMPGKLPASVVKEGQWMINGEAVRTEVARGVLMMLGRW